jgi:hypothetical protein
LAESEQYDGSLQMFVQEPRTPDPRRLLFMRWLVEHNHFGRPAVGPASGDLAATTIEVVKQPPSPS